MQTKMFKNKKHKKIASDFMPRDEQSLRILQERALHIAKQEIKKVEKKDAIAYVRFKLGMENYGISYEFAKEVMHNVVITKVPCVTDFVAGVINRRGILLMTLDLKKFFNIHSAENKQQDNYVIIIKKGSIQIALLVDSIEGSDVYDPAFLDLPLSQENLKQEYFIGLHQRIIAIINVNAILGNLGGLSKK